MLNADLVLGFCSHLGSADSAGATPVRAWLGPKESQVPSLHTNPQHKVAWAEKEIKDVAGAPGLGIAKRCMQLEHPRGEKVKAWQ